MIERIIAMALERRALVLLLSLLLLAGGGMALLRTPVDAIPDLSDVQVIVRASWPGQDPQRIEDQVSYPLTSTLLGLPRSRAVRGYSMYGDAFVYAIFEDGTDPYWARSRVLEALNALQPRLPRGARVELGPDASGLGWVYQYALIDRSGGHDLGELRALQDWFLGLELKSVPGVAEVATLGGMQRQILVTPLPERLRALGVGIGELRRALADNNLSLGAAAIELGEAEVLLRAEGYRRTPAEFAAIPLKVEPGRAPLRVADVARVEWVPALRRGIAELDGEGEVSGAVVVMRSGENAMQVIASVKRRLDELRPSLPAGVEIVETYDRSVLIGRAIESLGWKLAQELAVVALVCLTFLLHLRSALVAVVCLPLGILASFLAMRLLGIDANIMSLAGIAIAIGTMVDAAVVTVENAHKHFERWQAQHPGQSADEATRLKLVTAAAREVGPALFFSLLVVTLSFLPVLTLEAQEGRLFAPLAYTKSLAMAAGAGLSITLIPVLALLLLRGRIPREDANPLNRWLVAVYTPLVAAALRRPWMVLAGAFLLLLASAWPWQQLGQEFMPAMDEGDLLFMPSALPGLSPQKAAELLQQSARIIKTFPEVAHVHGKAGRAETATDPAPLEMFETVVRLKPRSQWRPGMSTAQLIDELDRALALPGLRNVWVHPIRNRIDMLATGVKSPLALKIAGPELATLEALAGRAASLLEAQPGALSVFPERIESGRYIDIQPDPLKLAQAGLDQAALFEQIALLLGGETIGEVVDGRMRFPVAMRYPRELRDSLGKLRELPLLADSGSLVALGRVARIETRDGPAMIRSENARPAAYVYIDVRGRDIGSFVAEARTRIADGLDLPPGYSLAWSGQFEFMERATRRLMWVLPLTLVAIVVLLSGVFRSLAEVMLVLATLPLALVGGVWLMWLLGHDFSVASAVGFIALAGLAAEFGVVMLVYLQRAIVEHDAAPGDETAMHQALISGAAGRVRPKAMTVLTIIAGLIPAMIGNEPGSEALQRIAAPMLGGMLSAPLLSMLVLPAAYWLLLRGRGRGASGTGQGRP